MLNRYHQLYSKQFRSPSQYQRLAKVIESRSVQHLLLLSSLQKKEKHINQVKITKLSLILINYYKMSDFHLPVPVPIPINDEPAFAIIARTSAKSTLTKPGICNQNLVSYICAFLFDLIEKARERRLFSFSPNIVQILSLFIFSRLCVDFSNIF